MSIASNVIEENEKLGTVRILLREKLTLNGVSYKNSDSIFMLLKRWAYTKYGGSSSIFLPNANSIREGNTVSAGVTVYDNDDNPVEGVPAEVIVNSVSYDVYSNSNGVAEKTINVGSAGDTLEITVSSGTDSQTKSYTIKSFEFEDNNQQNTNLYEVIKYPTSITHSISIYNYDSNYSKYGYLLSKAVSSGSVVMLIPDSMPAIDSTKTGVHFQVKMVQKKNSNSGWGDAIAFISSKDLTHYRDTKILELGAYNAKKGVKYSNSDHVERDLSTTSGQLTLDSVWYTFDMYYESGYLKATIYNGTTQVFSYEGDISSKISLDTFYPAIMVYNYGGAMIFNNVVIESWSKEE